MATTNKPRVIKDYDKLDKEVKDLIKETYPQGFAEKLIQYPNKDGLLISALPFETEDKMYLVRINTDEIKIVFDDGDDDDVEDIKESEMEEMNDIDEAASDDDDFDEKYAEEKTFGPGIEDDGEDDDDDEDDEELYDDDDDDDFDDDDDDEEIVVEKPKSAAKSKSTTSSKKTTKKK